MSSELHIADGGGDGAPILLVHGMAGNTHWWDDVAPRLTPGLRPAALDFSGHGDSAWRKDGAYTVEAWVEDIEAARKRLGWERMILAGHSLGARLALAYAHLRPERLSAVVAIDFIGEAYQTRHPLFLQRLARTQPAYPDIDSILARFHLEPPGTLLGPEELRTLARHCVKETEKGWTWKFDWRAFLRRSDPVWPILPDIRVPALIVRGDNSTVMNRATYKRVLRELKGARGVQIPRAHHHVPLDAPEELAEVMKAFLSKTAAAR